MDTQQQAVVRSAVRQGRFCHRFPGPVTVDALVSWDGGERHHRVTMHIDFRRRQGICSLPEGILPIEIDPQHELPTAAGFE